MIDLELLGLPKTSGSSRRYDTSTDGQIFSVNGSGVVRPMSVAINKGDLLNTEQFRQLLPALIRRVLEATTTHIAQIATAAPFMRPAWGERQWRDPGDDGPLRLGPGRLSDYARKAPFDPGRLSRSLFGERSNVAGIERIFEWSETADEIKLTYGTKVPYATLHEYGGVSRLPWNNRVVNIPARPYFTPAVNLSDQWLTDSMRDAIQAVTAAIEAQS